MVNDDHAHATFYRDEECDCACDNDRADGDG